MKSEGLYFVAMFRFYLLVAVVLSIFVVSCGSRQSGTEAPVKTGAVAFTVEWESPPEGNSPGGVTTASPRRMAPNIYICEDYGVKFVDLKVVRSASDTSVVVEKLGTPCTDNQATIRDVPVGTGYYLLVEGRMETGSAIWRGFCDNAFAVVANQETNVGKVTVEYKGTDNVAPWVSDFTPKDNATHVLNNSAIRIQFNERMAINTVQDPSAIVVTDNVSGPVAGTIMYNTMDNSATFTPNAPLASGAKISVSVTNIATDMAGHKMNPPAPWSFTAHVPGEFGNPIRLNPSNSGAAFSPKVAMDGEGNVVVVWRQSFDLYSNMYSISSNSWVSTAQRLELQSGSIGGYSVSMSKNGNGFAVWTESDGTNTRVYASQYRGASRSWDETPSGLYTTAGSNVFDLDINTDINGNALVVYTNRYLTTNFQTIMANRYWTTDFGGAPFYQQGWIGSREVLSQSSDNVVYRSTPKIAMDGNGHAVGVWQDNNYFIVANKYALDSTQKWGSWGTAEPINNYDGSIAVYPQIAMDASGNAIAVWQQDSSPFVIYANFLSMSSPAGWSGAQPLSLVAADSYTPKVVMHKNGNAIAVWVQTFRSEGGALLDTRIYSNQFDGSWGDATPIDKGTGQQGVNHMSILPQIAISDNGNAIAVWQEYDYSANQQISLWYNRYLSSTKSWSGAKKIDYYDGVSLFKGFLPEPPHVAMDGNGNSCVVWVKTNEIDYTVWAYRSF